MANTFTADAQMEPMSVSGNKRLVMGVLTMTDGGPGGAAATGLDVIAGATLTPKSASSNSIYPPTLLGINTGASGNGDIKALSAGSGDKYFVIAWGR